LPQFGVGQGCTLGWRTHSRDVGRSMYTLAAKLVSFVTYPSNIAAMLFFAGAILLFSRFAWAGRMFAAAGALVLAIAAFSPAADYFLTQLEDRFPVYRDDGKPVAGIVVLGGALTVPITLERRQLALNNAGERIVYLGDLARRHPDARIIFSGGGAQRGDTVRSEATALEGEQGALGLAPGRVIYERESLNTFENAENSLKLANPKAGERWLLVTSAYHMPRAMGAFRKAGFGVVAYPVDYRGEASASVFDLPANASQGLARADFVAKEYAGLFGYWLIGKSDALFPEP
jgi:uncharacterized SAM-binding protein YcdF (DUF218 family)